MSKKIFRKGFSLTEVMATLAVFGCILVLGFGMFNSSKMNNDIAQTKKARLDLALRNATMSIVKNSEYQQNIAKNTICDVNALVNELSNRISGQKTTGTVNVNGDDKQALIIKDLGTIVVDVDADCRANYANGGVPVALYSTPDENISALNVPSYTKAGTTKEALSEGLSNQSNDAADYSADFTALVASADGLTETYSHDGRATLAAANLPGLKGESNEATNAKTGNFDHAVCSGGLYNGAVDGCPDLNIAFYSKWQGSAPSCENKTEFCQGNAEIDGNLILTGKVNTACKTGQGNYGQCECPLDYKFWVDPYYYTIVSSDGTSKVEGRCVDTCTMYPHMKNYGTNCKCDAENGYQWVADPAKTGKGLQGQCCKDGVCDCDPGFKKGPDGKTCVCDKDYVTNPDNNYLEADEIYSDNVANGCKTKCIAPAIPNETKDACIYPECECFKARNNTTLTCECKASSAITEAELKSGTCSVADDRYYNTGSSSCISQCEVIPGTNNVHLVRNENNITQCKCPSQQPEGMALTRYEKYNPDNTMNCRSCDPQYTNREYAAGNSFVCACKAREEIDFTTQYANYKYNPDKDNCVEECPEGTHPNADHSDCIGNCDCLQKWNYTTHQCECDITLTPAQIKACNAFNNDGDHIFDATSSTCQKECLGTSSANENVNECICASCAQTYNGQTCVCDETKATSSTCGFNANTEVYDANNPPTCKACKSPNRVYNPQGICECKSLQELISSGAIKSNQYYDITKEDCISDCGGILVRNDKNECVCPTERPVTFEIKPGKHYDSTAKATGCVSPCPAGNYCPGVVPNDPTPDPDPADNPPTKNPDYPTGDVWKCPCGTYSNAQSAERVSQCTTCPAGTKCLTQGLTAPVACSGTDYCPQGTRYQCTLGNCPQPTEPDKITHTTCVCKQSRPDGYYIEPGKRYDANSKAKNAQNNLTCLSDCVPGTYCPGSKSTTEPNTPNISNNDPYDHVHEQVGGDMFVYKCPCGRYGSSSALQNSACSGPCAAGYHCDAGSTSAQARRCSDGKYCEQGVCDEKICTQDGYIPDADRTTCICGRSQAGAPAGTYFDATTCAYVECPIGHYCPGGANPQPKYNEPVNDPNNPAYPYDPEYNNPDGTINPAVIYCPCGKYQNETRKSECKSDCALGYKCPKGSTNNHGRVGNSEHKCAANEKCPVGTCTPDTCALPFVVDPSTQQCVCAEKKPIGWTLQPGYKYDKTAVSTGCVRTCPPGDYCPGLNPDDDPDDKPDTYTCPCGTYSSGSTQSVNANCMGTCDVPGFYCPPGSKSKTEHQITTGWYFVQAECTIKKCPKGHYCPGINDDPNNDPDKQDPQYPTGVYYCPCGTYGNAEALSNYNCTANCTQGQYCDRGTITPSKTCDAGYTCRRDKDNQECKVACTFPSTSVAGTGNCNKCLSELAIKAQKSDYFKTNEIWVDDISKNCKKCKSNMVPVAGGGCACPSDKPYWDEQKGECVPCEPLGILYFARNYTASATECKLVDFMQGKKSCFKGSDGRVVPQDMKDAANRLINADKSVTFDNVFAFVVADNGTQSKVVGAFTMKSWYVAFPDDWDSDYNKATTQALEYAKSSDTDKSCTTLCAGINSNYMDMCKATCEKFKGNTKTTMFDSENQDCKYAVAGDEYAQFRGEHFGTRSDELCTGGSVWTNHDQCDYMVGAMLRRRYSPLVLDLKGDGFAYTSDSDGVIFDINNDGKVEKISWTTVQTEFDNAFLILDKNKNGQVDNGGELFGDQNGEENGFKELAKYDENGDKVINKKDAIYTELRLWADMNKNAKIDYEADGTSKELKTLEEAKVKEISVDFEKLVDANGNVLEDMYGNLVGFMGKFKMMVEDAAGKLVETVRKMMDVFFVGK